MDKQIRELERSISEGDIEAQNQLDHLKIRNGEAPSIDFIVDAWKNAVQIQRDYLYKAAKDRVQSIFQRHLFIKKVSWFAGVDHEDIPFWFTEGIKVSVDDDYYDEEIFICRQANYFNGFAILNHLDGNCDCRCTKYNCKEEKHPKCICYYDDVTQDLLPENQEKFKAALIDLKNLYLSLDGLPWGHGIYSDQQYFSFKREK